MSSAHYINLEQLGWPGPDFDAILAEVEMHQDDPTAYLCKNLRDVTSAARRGVVILLGKLGDRRSLSTLMRYVFDTPGEVLEEDARAVAMKAIIDITDAQDEDASDRLRVADFLMEMADEPDGFVRGLVMSGLGRFGSRSALDVLKDAWEDEHQFVVDSARSAYRELSDRAHLLPEIDDERPHQEMEDEVLLDRIRFANITDLKPFLHEFAKRPHVLELADRYLSSGSKRNHYILEVLPELNDPAGRNVVARHLEMASDETDMAASLGVLAHYLNGDATAAEREAIESGLRSSSSHIQRAALLTAGVAGDDHLLEGVIAALSSKDLEIVLAAATAVDEALGADDARWLQPVRKAFVGVHQRRIQYEFPRDIQTEALLLRSLARISTPDDADQMRHGAFKALEDVRAHRPILAAALRLIHSITPIDGLPASARWTREQAWSLILLIPYSDASLRRQLVDLLSRGAPDYFERGVNILVELARKTDLETRVQLVGLIGRSGDRATLSYLYDFARDPEEDIVEAAGDALRHLKISVEDMPDDVVDILLNLDERQNTKYFKAEFDRLAEEAAEREAAAKREAEEAAKQEAEEIAVEDEVGEEDRDEDEAADQEE